MDKSKIVSVFLFVIILGVGFVGYNFYVENLELTESNRSLEQVNRELQEERDSLEQARRIAVRERDQKESELNSVRQTLSTIERERDDLENRYQRIVRERDDLATRLAERPEPARVDPSPDVSDRSDDYWADFVQKQAKLKAEIEQFEQRMLDIQSKNAQLRKENRKLSLRADELNKEKEILEEEIKTRERALRIASMDLVSERQQRGRAVQEVGKLRKETADLKNELIVTNERKGQVQDRLKETLDRKISLEHKITEAENILKEKSVTLAELQSGLQRAIKEGRKEAVLSDTVELPPIVVRPDAPATRDLRGEIIAVNPDEKFVVFDLGEESGVRPGLLLRVMRGGREIATLEVIETRRNISAADIKEVVGGFQIKEGDAVIAR